MLQEFWKEAKKISIPNVLFCQGEFSVRNVGHAINQVGHASIFQVSRAH